MKIDAIFNQNSKAIVLVFSSKIASKIINLSFAVAEERVMKMDDF